MAKASCFDGNFQTFARMIASHGVIVALVDFRNSTVPARKNDQISAFPGGLNDCVSSVRWIHSNRPLCGGGTRSRVILAGESGGGNLSIATALLLKQCGDLDRMVDGVYAMCPFISGQYTLSSPYSSTFDHEGIVLTRETMQTFVVGYGDECRENKIAWPSRCKIDDLRGLCPIVISVNEFDPLRDEGLEFYHKCLEAGVKANGVVISGTVHATDNYFVGTAPHIARATAGSLASFAWGGGDGGGSGMHTCSTKSAAEDERKVHVPASSSSSSSKI